MYSLDKLINENILNKFDILNIKNKLKYNKDDLLCVKEIINNIKRNDITNIRVNILKRINTLPIISLIIKNIIKDIQFKLENIYIITEKYPIEICKDVHLYFPDEIKTRFYTESLLTNTIFRDIEEKKNVLIILDHVNITIGNDMYNKLLQYNLLSKDYYKQSNKKFIEFTNYPNETIYYYTKKLTNIEEH